MEQKLSKCATAVFSIIGVWGALFIVVYLFESSKITHTGIGIIGILYLMVAIAYFLHKRIDRIEESIREQQEKS